MQKERPDPIPPFGFIPLRESNLTTKLTGGNGAQRNCGQVERLVICISQ
jgi:hypothetical protein